MNKVSFIVLFIFLASFIYCDDNYDEDNDDEDNNEIKIEIKTDLDISDSDEPPLAPVLDTINISDFSSAEDLWRIFLENPDSEISADILITLGLIGKGDRSVIENLNNYLLGKNILVKSGAAVHYSIVSACITALMELGDSSSYHALFSAYCAGYPEVIANEAYGALEAIPGNLFQFFLSILWNNPPDEKYAAFRAGINSERLNLSERGQLAEVALEQSLLSAEENFDITSMRYNSVLTLTDLKWTRANPLAIRHYYRVQSDFLQNAVLRNRYIEAINCLGAVGNSQAALVLGLQLGLLNSRINLTGNFDGDIVLAVIRALGSIGDNAAFDNLLYVSDLPYPEYIQAAAREAINRLRWNR
ncbi:MAG: hypothetical protein FWD47_12730 [Treponema sp.]|nr:hypothetical protein [Treponema sp.]